MAEFMNQLGILVQTGKDEREANVIFTTPPGPTHHLVEFRGGQINEFVSVEAIALYKNHGPGRKIDTGRNGGGGEDGLQHPHSHHLFHEHFPVRQLASVVGSHP